MGSEDVYKRQEYRCQAVATVKFSKRAKNEETAIQKDSSKVEQSQLSSAA